MGYVQVIYRWAAGETLVATVKAKSTYPDALDQARAEAIRAFKEAWAAISDEPVPDGVAPAPDA